MCCIYKVYKPWLAVFSNIHSSLRRQKVTEAKFLEKETTKRLEEAIRKKVEASLNDDDVKVEINSKMEEGRRRLNEEVAAQLEKEKEAALIEAQRKEVHLFLMHAIYIHLDFIGSVRFGSGRCLRSSNWFCRKKLEKRRKK